MEKWKTRRPGMLILVLILAVVWPRSFVQAQSGPENVYVVERVIDAQTLVIRGGQEVRLIGVSSPSPYEDGRNKRLAKKHPEAAESDLYEAGENAKGFVKFLVEGKRVLLELDPQLERFGHRDRKGRVMAYVWYTAPIFQEPPAWLVMDPDAKTHFDAFLNPSVIRAGYGVTETEWPFVYGAKFMAVENEARENGRGLWQDGTQNSS